jgi:hypothetical protein
MSIATFQNPDTLGDPYTLGFKSYPISSSAYTSTCFTEPHYSMCKFPKCDSNKPTSVMNCPIKQVSVLKSIQPI